MIYINLFQHRTKEKIKHEENYFTRTNAEAEAILIEAQAQAEANRMLSESLSAALLEQMYYEKWNGELPYIYGADNTLMQVPVG